MGGTDLRGNAYINIFLNALTHTRTHAHPRASDTQRIEITEKLIPSHFPLYLSPSLSLFSLPFCVVCSVGGIGRHKSIVQWFHSLSCIQWRWVWGFYLFLQHTVGGNGYSLFNRFINICGPVGGLQGREGSTASFSLASAFLGHQHSGERGSNGATC